MQNLSGRARMYILTIIVMGAALAARSLLDLPWDSPWLYVTAILGAVAQTLKVEGPNSRTNYSIAWFVYGFAFLALGPSAALFVVVIAHLAEWAWHKYPWFIQAFNIGNHVIALCLAAWVFQVIGRGMPVLGPLGAFALVSANLVFVLANHFMVGLVVKLARGQSFAESGVFEFLTLFLDFTILSMGSITALVWQFSPVASLLNILPLYLLYHAIRVPALLRQLKEMKDRSGQMVPVPSGD